jgi:hypothetical protein
MALEVYLNNTEVTLAIDLIDSAGNALTVNSVDSRVVNQDGTELVARAPLSGFSAGDATASVTVPANLNVVATGNTREIRTIDLYCQLESGTVLITRSYAVELTDPLVVGVNTFQGFPQAQLTALDMPNIDAWHAASDQQKLQALMDAREHIVQLNFNLLNSNVNFGQDQLAYVPEGQFQSSYVARNSLFIFNGNLAILNATQYAALPERFKTQLRKAQVAEANFILGGSPTDSMRNAGIIEDKVGESSQRFRDRGVPLHLPVCRRALDYLSYYVTFAKRIGRSG